jgi:hypothetical protein
MALSYPVSDPSPKTAFVSGAAEFFMKPVEQEKLRYRVMALCLLAILPFCCVPCIWPILRWPDPKPIVDGIPAGSKLTELKAFIPAAKRGKFRVWRKVAEKQGEHDHRVKISSVSFFVREVAKEEDWLTTSPELAAFTGKIELHHFSSAIPDDLAPSWIIELVYVDGVLIEKRYGYLLG